MVYLWSLVWNMTEELVSNLLKTLRKSRLMFLYCLFCICHLCSRLPFLECYHLFPWGRLEIEQSQRFSSTLQEDIKWNSNVGHAKAQKQNWGRLLNNSCSGWRTSAAILEHERKVELSHELQMCTSAFGSHFVHKDISPSFISYSASLSSFPH